MKYGFALPKTTDGAAMVRFAKAVEDLGFESVWVGDHIVLPIEETDQYPYTPDGRFVTRPDDPQLDAFIVLRLHRFGDHDHRYRHNGGDRAVPQPDPTSKDVRNFGRAYRWTCCMRCRRWVA